MVFTTSIVLTSYILSKFTLLWASWSRDLRRKTSVLLYFWYRKVTAKVLARRRKVHKIQLSNGV